MPVLLAAQGEKADLVAEANAAYRSLRPSDAIDLYRKYLALHPNRADVRVFLGGALLNQGQLESAFAEAKQAIALDDDYAKGYLLAGRVCAAKEQWECAQSFFEKAVRLDPRDIDAWYFSGRASYDANRFEVAVKAFEQAIRIGAKQSRVYENLGLAQDRLGLFGDAEKSFRAAIDLAGGACRPYLVYGAFLFRHARPAQSLLVLKQALALAPAAVSVRFELARVLYHDNKLEEAAEVLEPALASNECRIHNLLIRIYSNSGKIGPAEAELKAMDSCKAVPDSP